MSETSKLEETYFEQILSEGKSVAAMAEEIGYMVEENARLIEKVAIALDKSQPYGSGKIGIRWWKKHDKRVPIVVEWKQNSKSKEYYTEEVNGHIAKRAKSHTAAFRVNHSETVELLQIAEKALETRNALVKFQTGIKMAVLRLHKAHKSTMEFQRERVAEIMEVTGRNLAEWEEQKGPLIEADLAKKRERADRRKAWLMARKRGGVKSAP